MFQSVAQNPAKTFFLAGFAAISPMALITLIGSEKLRTMFSGRDMGEILTMTSAYFAFFGMLTMLSSLGYWLKTKNGGVTNGRKSQWQLGLFLGALGVFGSGAMMGPQIGQRLMGGFVAISLLLMLIGLIIFVANLVTKKNEADGAENA